MTQEEKWESSPSTANKTVLTGKITQPADRPPPTLEDMLSKFKVDTDTWSVERFTVNQWEQGSSNEGKIQITALYQVKLILVRKIAVETTMPCIKPVELKVSLPKKTKQQKTKMKKAIYLSDSHLGFHRDLSSGNLIPFHDRLHWSALISYLKQNSVDQVILGGDMLDMGDMSDKFAQSPDGYFTTQPAILELAWLIGQLMQVIPSYAKIIYIEGNHENRLPRFLLNHFGSAFALTSATFTDQPILSVPQLITANGVDPSRFIWVGDYPNGEYWINSNTRLIHGHVSKKRPGATGLAYLENVGATTIYGHIHRRETVSMTRHSRINEGQQANQYIAESFGMFGVPSQVPPFKTTTDWSQGFGLLSYDEKDFHTQYIPLQEGGFSVADTFYQGSDYTKQLVRDTKWSALSYQ